MQRLYIEKHAFAGMSTFYFLGKEKSWEERDY